MMLSADGTARARCRPDEARFTRRVAAIVALLMLPVAYGLHSVTGSGTAALTGWAGQGAAVIELPARSQVLAADGSRLAVFYRQDRIPVRLDQVSPAARDAILATEDARFYSHGALDPVALVRAAVANLTAGEVLQGASTLTQQYAKQVALEQAEDAQRRRAATEITFARKMRELGQALAVEQELTKDEILRRYLNIVYFGNGAYGIEMAARRYFSVSARELTVPQAAVLAGLIKSPTAFDPLDHPDAARARREVVLRRMADAGVLEPALATQYATTELALNPSSTPNGCAPVAHPFFCDYVLAEVRTLPALGATPAERVERLLTGGLTVHTTLDPQVQRAAERAVRDRVGADQEHGAAIVMTQPGTGAVRAIALSRGYGEGPGRTTLNWALDAAQGGSTGFQAGSTFKAFVIAAAAARGIAHDTYLDAPARITLDGFRSCDGAVDFPSYTVRNYDGHAYGEIDMREATARSVNTWFAQLAEQTGVCAPPALAEQMGLRRADGGPLNRVPSFVLGVDEVSPLRMAEAYATLAARGEHCSSHAITAIVGPSGASVPLSRAPCRQVMSAQAADMVSDMLRGVIDGADPRRTGGHLSLGETVSAGKTGTTDNSTAVWFVGYTDRLAAAVWAGYPDAAKPLRRIRVGDRVVDVLTGATLPGPIWAAAMAGALGLPEDADLRQAQAADRIEDAREAAERGAQLRRQELEDQRVFLTELAELEELLREDLDPRPSPAGTEEGGEADVESHGRQAPEKRRDRPAEADRGWWEQW